MPAVSVVLELIQIRWNHVIAAFELRRVGLYYCFCLHWSGLVCVLLFTVH